MTRADIAALLARIAAMPEPFRRQLIAIEGPRAELHADGVIVLAFEAGATPWTSVPLDSVGIAACATTRLECGVKMRIDVFGPARIGAICALDDAFGETAHIAAIGLLAKAFGLADEWEGTR